MKKVKLNIFVFLFLFSGLFFSADLLAQQESQYTQYIYNTMSINPAYTGGRGRLSVMTLYRNQWVGLEGAPQALNISGHSPVGNHARVGVGAEFNNDKIGPATTNIVAGNFSYVIPFSSRFHWSFGVKAGVLNLNLDSDKLNIYDQNNLDLSINNRMMPVLGIGTYFYGKKWYIGISSPNFLETKHYDEIKISTAKEKMHLYFIIGYLIEINEKLALKPSALIKVVQGSPLAADIALTSVFYKRFNLGISYRTTTAVSAMSGFQINDYLMIGYAYDYTTSALARYNNGSHEIFLRFELGEIKTVFNTKNSGASF